MRLTLEIEGERFEVEVQRMPDGLKVECEDDALLLRGAARGSAVELQADGDRWLVEIESDEQAMVNGRRVGYHVAAFAPGAPPGAGGHVARIPVRAVMHGRLVKVLAESGQHVAKGEPLFILEAMKMQNELASPAEGTVTQLVAKPGEVVDVGRVLAWLERRA